MLRKAGEIMADYMREKTLADNRKTPIGAGNYGVLYESNIPGNVIKEVIVPESKQDYVFGNTLKEETDLQAIAAEMGLAPRVAGLEQFPGGAGNRMEMADIRNNFESVEGEGDRWGQYGVGIPVDPMVNIRTAQQLGQLALKGVQLEDRRAANIVKNKMTGRPMQLDFGMAKRVTGADQVQALANATSEGFEAAGIPEMGEMLRGIVFDYLEGGQVQEAMDVAKQGFSRLQKIKKEAPY